MERDVRAILEYKEDKAKEEFRESKPFDEIVAELIRRGIIIIDYWLQSE